LSSTKEKQKHLIDALGWTPTDIDTKQLFHNYAEKTNNERYKKVALEIASKIKVEN